MLLVTNNLEHVGLDFPEVLLYVRGESSGARDLARGQHTDFIRVCRLLQADTALQDARKTLSPRQRQVS